MGSFPELVIFDCDGVLVDSEPISIHVLRQMIEEAGLLLDESEAYRLFLGRSVASISETLATEFGLSITDAHLEGMRMALRDRFRQELQPVPGVASVLHALKEKGIALCVASSSLPERIRLSLSVTGLLDLLEPHIYSSSMVERGKPAPDLFLHAAREMGVDPSACLVIEDSPAGITAARSAGMRVFGFTGGSHAAPGGLAAGLAALSPDHVFDDMAQLPDLIAGTAAASACLCAVDVGTGSARAGIVDSNGKMLGRGEHPIVINRPVANHAEHDSTDIWSAVCRAVRAAIAASGVEPGKVAGIGFDATCSLVVRDGAGRPLSVSVSGEQRWDTIVWLDHRAISEADECTASGHPILAYLGGAMSPEMQTPKLMWLKRNLPETWQKAGHIFDLADFLTFKASGRLDRSQCTIACKWAYLPQQGGWQHDLLERVGLDDLIDRGALPAQATAVGADLGPLLPEAADALGLTTSCRVSTGLIDAYAGAIGVLAGQADSRSHAALIAGTSSCLMAISDEPQPIPGGWGPYLGAALPGRWIVEGGQSATGALLDHLIRWHAAGGEPDRAMHARICRRVAELREQDSDLAPRLHVLPDFHGNRSPLADPHAVGVISGLTLDASFDSLCRLYWRTAVGIALGVRHILEALNASGYAIDTLHVTGGHTRNPLLMELYADATGCTVIEPAPDDAVLTGAAIAAATAAGFYPDVASACRAMQRRGSVRRPNAESRGRIERDYRIFLEMHRQRKALDLLS
jgi:FGGY-family pentulose kinase/HAD superfamily hydrolase (TIGR01509 family)